MAVPGIPDARGRDLAGAARPAGVAGYLVRAHPSGAGCGGCAGRCDLAGPELARCRGPGGGRRDRIGWVAGLAAGVVQPVRRGSSTELVPVVVLPASVDGRDDAGRAGTCLPGPADVASTRRGE